MTTQDKQTLITFFQTGDIPTGTNYANLIESQVNVAETSAQTMLGSLITTELVTPRVSASNINVTGVMSASTLSVATANITTVVVSSVSVTGSVSAAAGGFVQLSTNQLQVVGGGVLGMGGGDIQSADSIECSAFAQSSGTVSAAGTTQGAAAPLLYSVNICDGVVDGSATGFRLTGNNLGRSMFLYNDSVSANLWPPTGGTINALSVNANFPLAASTLYTIIPISTSAYAVK